MPNNLRTSQVTAVTSLLDDTNRRILEQLQLDGRLSMAELGRRVGLSPPAVAERVQRLESEGVISGYSAEIDPEAVGFVLGAILRIRPASRQLSAVADLARDTPEVIECLRITGDDCFLMRLVLRDVRHLEEVIDRFTPYGDTTTSIMQSSPVTRRPLPLA